MNKPHILLLLLLLAPQPHSSSAQPSAVPISPQPSSGSAWPSATPAAIAAPSASPSAAPLAALIDKACYLTGERLHVSLSLDDTDPSRVVYIEVSDTQHLYAQAMAQLQAGRGWADIALPQTMHSGNYTVTAYTRQMLAQRQQPHTQVISVVNVGHVTRADQITFMQPDSTALPVPYRSYRPGEVIEAIPPVEASDARMLTLTFSAYDLQTPDYSDVQPTFQLPDASLPLEYEGHVVIGRLVGNHDINQSFLSRVGKDALLFEGKPVGEGLFQFYTRGMNGRMATALTAVNHDGNTIPMQFVSPYAKLLPSSLPALQVYCTDQQLRQRSLSAQREELLSQQLAIPDTLPHSFQFMGDETHRLYDLDEWRRFSSVRQIIVEFLSAVHRRRENGTNFLHIFDPEINKVSALPALVLLDGVPVYDLDRFLDYDARLLKYVQIYSKDYVFGNLVFHGAILFISQRGLLTNYKLEAGTQLVTYDFPQLRPAFQIIAPNVSGTLYWNPDVCPTAGPLHLTAPGASPTATVADTSASVVIPPASIPGGSAASASPSAVPPSPSLYQLLWQWLDADGHPHAQRGYIAVTQ